MRQSSTLRYPSYSFYSIVPRPPIKTATPSWPISPAHFTELLNSSPVIIKSASKKCLIRACPVFRGTHRVIVHDGGTVGRVRHAVQVAVDAAELLARQRLETCRAGSGLH